MPSTTRARPGAPNIHDTTFTRNLRYELAGEEGRALLGSYGISIGLAVIFLLFVYLSDPAPLLPASPDRVEVTLVDIPDEAPTRQPEAAAPAPAPRPAAPSPAPASPTPTRRTDPGAVREAFGTPRTGGMVGDVTNVLRGTDVVTGTGGVPVSGGGGRVVLAPGEGGTGSRTPGRGGISGTPGGTASVGAVGGTGSVGRAAVSVRAPSVVEPPPLGGPGRDMSDLGTFVRSRQSELRYCYEEQGLKTNPGLAGTIYVAITIAGSGGVTNANITRRTWSGPGSSSAESCILSRIRGWRFPQSAAGEGTYAFPFNFTT